MVLRHHCILFLLVSFRDENDMGKPYGDDLRRKYLLAYDQGVLPDCPLILCHAMHGNENQLRPAEYPCAEPDFP